MENLSNANSTPPIVTAPPRPPAWDLIEVMQASLGTVLAAAIVATAGGVGWLVTKLPARLDRIDMEIRQLQQVKQAIKDLEANDAEQDRRIIRLEVGR
jgi:H+/gluconate symporter-like permease